MRYVYPCILSPEADGGFSVSFPDVEGANTGGATREEALSMAEDALVAALGAYHRLRREVPLPSPIGEGQEAIRLEPIAAAKIALGTAMRQQGLSNIGLAKALGVTESAVRKLLNPDHRSHISTVDRALQAVGRSLIVEDQPAAQHPKSAALTSS